MGIISTILGVFGFGIGVSVGLVIGYYLFIYFQPTDVKPHVDFGLRLFGADLMSIPGLYRFVQEQIKDQVANMYLWPRTLQVQILDPSKAGEGESF